jgi:glycosyltransferase involved in cell wall biosynthesis
MPVAEAMAAGLPVVSSDGGALPEVVGAGGVVVKFRKHVPGPPDLDDARDFASALAQVLGAPSRQAELSAAGISESERFRRGPVRAHLLTAYSAAMDAARRRSGQ